MTDERNKSVWERLGIVGEEETIRSLGGKGTHIDNLGIVYKWNGNVRYSQFWIDKTSGRTEDIPESRVGFVKTPLNISGCATGDEVEILERAKRELFWYSKTYYAHNLNREAAYFLNRRELRKKFRG